MNKNMDHAAMIEALDAALLEQVKRWRTFVSAEDIAGDAGDVDWMEEFCLVVRNRVVKLQRQRVLAQACQPVIGTRPCNKPTHVIAFSSRRPNQPPRSYR